MDLEELQSYCKDKEITPWLPLSTVRSRGKYYPKQSKCGVYQLSSSKIDELIHEEIGYIGESKNVEDRIYAVHLGLRGKKSNHTVGKWLKSNGFDGESTYYRIIFLENEEQKFVEKCFHEIYKEKFGYTYKWQGSGGNAAGRDFQLLDSVNEAPFHVLINDIYPLVKKRLTEELPLHYLNGDLNIKFKDK